LPHNYAIKRDLRAYTGFKFHIGRVGPLFWLLGPTENFVRNLFVLIFLIAIALPSIRWLRLVWFRAGALRVITKDFSYEPAIPGFQSDAFNSITREIRKSGGNQYDAAIFFMLVQFDSMSKPYDPKAKEFIAAKLSLIKKIVERSNSGSKLVQNFLIANQENLS
jgi:hypothetical protein